jgi:DNA-binding response OmpR family regulator
MALHQTPDNGIHEAPEILLVCDDPEDVQVMELHLTTAGYSVSAASDPESALRIADENNSDLVIVNIGIPAPALVEKMRAGGHRRLLLVSESNHHQIEAMQTIPADDYMTRPIRIDDLLARLTFLLPQPAAGGGSPLQSQPVVRAGHLEINLESHAVYRAGERLELSRTDWLLLGQLARRPGQPVMDQELLVRTWGPEYRHEAGFLHTYVEHLRMRLDDTEEPHLIRRFHDVGYFLSTD